MFFSKISKSDTGDDVLAFICPSRDSKSNYWIDYRDEIRSFYFVVSFSYMKSVMRFFVVQKYWCSFALYYFASTVHTESYLFVYSKRNYYPLSAPPWKAFAIITVANWEYVLDLVTSDRLALINANTNANRYGSAESIIIEVKDHLSSSTHKPTTKLIRLSLIYAKYIPSHIVLVTLCCCQCQCNQTWIRPPGFVCVRQINFVFVNIQKTSPFFDLIHACP